MATDLNEAMLDYARAAVAERSTTAHNPVPRAVDDELVELWPDDPPRLMHVPHGYGDLHRIRADLAAARWEDVWFGPFRLQHARS